MSPASYAGFDPVFWLHHANVDRYVAMWQAIYVLLPPLPSKPNLTLPAQFLDPVLC